MPANTGDRLTEDEMVEILEDIARHGRNQAAQIAAIKTLREIRKGEKPDVSGFAELDGSTRRLRAV